MKLVHNVIRFCMRFGTPLPTIAFLKGSNAVFFYISRMMYTLWSGPRVAIVEIMTMIVAVVMAIVKAMVVMRRWQRRRRCYCPGLCSDRLSAQGMVTP